MKRVLVTDTIDPICATLLQEQGIGCDLKTGLAPEELMNIVPDYQGWIIRSGTTITAGLIEAAENLEVIGRAGVGVDNVDLDAATRRGVLVLNAPEGNTISTAEHTCAMLLTLTRRIPSANRSIIDGAWTRKAFFGAELYGKTLGIVGVGKIGRAVGVRMKQFGMTVLGYDPVIAADVADSLGIKKVGLETLLEKSDFITFHAPLNEHTKDMVNQRTLSLCKDGVYIVNCARGGIVCEDDLLAALESGKVAGAALDVFKQEPPGEAQRALIRHPNVISTPHIAASTSEAQEKVARQVTEQVINALQGRPVMTPVNGDAIKLATQHEVQPYLRLTEQLGKVVVQLVGCTVGSVSVRHHGDVGHRYAEILTISALKGVLSQVVDGPVNYINARQIAKESGVRVEEQRSDVRGNYRNMVEVEIQTNGDGHSVSGTVFGEDDYRIVGIDSYDLEVVPEGHLLLYTNEDRPGRLASVSGILADAGINIGAVALGRKGPGLMALTVLTLDEDISEDVRRRIADTEGVLEVVVVSA